MGDGGLDLVFEVRVKLGRVVDDPWLGKLATDLRRAALSSPHVEAAEVRVDATAHLGGPMSAVDKALEHVTEGRLRLRERVARRQFDPEEVRRVINDALAEYFAISPGYASLNCWAHDRPRPCAECDEAAAQAVPPVPFGSKGKTLLEEKGLAGSSPPPAPPAPPPLPSAVFEFLRDVGTGYDCDTGANESHPDSCRSCRAQKLFEAAGGTVPDWAKRGSG